MRHETPDQLDTKLHRTPTKSDWIQVAFYSKQLARLQDCSPNLMHIVLGDGSTVGRPVEDLTECLDQLEADAMASLEADYLGGPATA